LKEIAIAHMSPDDYQGLVAAATADSLIDNLLQESWGANQLLELCEVTLKIVSVGIWRNKAENTCGLAGAALTVHAVEEALSALSDFRLR
jgi:hypothetical protein